MTSRTIGDRLRPWGGIFAGTFGAGFAHQLGVDSTLQDCTVGSPLIVTIATIAGLVIVGGGAFASWTVYSAEGETAPRRFIAGVSLMTAALFAIAVILPFIAAMLIPRCWQ
jgi:hypothetical protein